MVSPWFFRSLIIVSNLVVAGAAALVIVVLLLLPGLPNIETIRTLELKVPLRVYSSDGFLMGEYGSERRIPVRINDAPPALIAAVLSAEDDRFYEHVGIDYKGILRAIYVNIQSGAKSQGASTITMQVTRNFFLTKERTYIRKANEALLALRLEQLLTKDEILELYLNKIFLGHRAYGFGAAAVAYYGNSLDDLDLAQYAMLAALPKAPSRVNPVSNPEEALVRRNYILDRMLELGYISEQEHITATESLLTAQLHLAEVELRAPYVAEYIRQQLYEKFGGELYEDGYSVYATVNSKDQIAAVRSLREGLISYDMRHGYRGPPRNWDIARLDTDKKRFDALKQLESSQEIVPVLVLEVQDDKAIAATKTAEQITIPWEQMKWARLQRSSRELGPPLKSPHDVLRPGDIIYARPVDEGEWMLSQIPTVEGALIAVNPRDGAIKAMVGGFDYYLGKFNRATQAVRQIGSNIKPFVYSAALETGFTGASLVSGAPVVVEDESTEILWRPENYSGKFYGQTRLRKALGLSLNLVSVRLIRSMGTEFAIDHISKFGFDKETLPKGLSLALGSAAATPLKVVSGYSVFANGGYEINPYIIDIVKDRDGKVVMRGQISKVCKFCLEGLFYPLAVEDQNQPLEAQFAKRVISSANVYVMNDMLRAVVASGTARKAQSLKRSDLAGKTGTTNDFEDAWFSGFNADLAATVWVGFDKPSDLGQHEAGSKAALPIWIEFMKSALQDIPETPLQSPDNVVVAMVHPETGEAVNRGHPDALREVFIVGSEPKLSTVSPIATDGSGDTTASPQQTVDDLF